ncbi:aldehyde dehydrogenase family protein [Croceicoccus naphthovorans]|uniref:Betaine-aldehyde dehydrogenase n=1 Tax=Croceicoccus naphthovorans TaxID=1348774 RepID=A0A0G3XGT5_9SPHN|nr:aldehyde dehydrogenase family protein [Croceicoccus naphthovorans]AKM10745.1 betaine-aldehyde dehydrogenase [Croceicoccus naphthovorans]MBB3988931.1 acyl-CoA reductase-like NAD-dependent aldehyde dehydrogenase [Croceicoccus naphthovorans]
MSEALEANRIQHPLVETYLKSGAKKLFIGGQWIDGEGGRTFDSIDPATGQTLATVAHGSAADVDKAVAAARKAFDNPAWRTMSPHERTRLLLKLADVLEANVEELATLQSHDMGLMYPFSQYMVASMADVMRYYAGWTTKIFGNTFPQDGNGIFYTKREPLGVVGAIIPWNGPILAAVWKIAPALACGNTIVFKPAEQAPLVPLRLAELFEEAGLPEGVLNIVTGDGATGAAMVAHPGIAKISFTGSVETGQRIIAEGAKTMKKVTVELGGKSPTIIFPDADMARAIPTAVMGFTSGAGQGCVCGTRILVHESVYDDVASQIAAAVQDMKIGSPFDADTQITPIISREQLDKINNYVDIGRKEGATIATGGETYGDKGFFMKPTLMTGVTNDMRVMQEEIFGPVAGILPFKDTEEAIRLANDVTYGLSASIWTDNLTNAQIVSDSVQAGMVWVNTIFEFDPMVPFGGYKQSGMGRELGPDSLEAFTQTKTVMLRH